MSLDKYTIEVTTAESINQRLDQINIKLDSILSKLNGETEPTIPTNPIDPSLGETLWVADMKDGTTNQFSGNTLMEDGGGKVLINEVSNEKMLFGNPSIKTKVLAGIGQMASTQYFLWSESQPPNTLKAGSYVCWYYLEEPFDMHPQKSWHNMMQWKAKVTSGRSHPVFTIGVDVMGDKGTGSKNTIKLRHTREKFGQPSYDVTPLIQKEVPIKKWFRIRADYIQDSINGSVKVWLDNDLMYDIKNVNTRPIQNAEGLKVISLNCSFNNYAGGLIPSECTLYISNVSIHSIDK